jgi:hypothetical protein
LAVFFSGIPLFTKLQASFSTTGSHHPSAILVWLRRRRKGRKGGGPPTAQADSRHDPQISIILRRACSFRDGQGLRKACRLPMEESEQHEVGDSSTHDAIPLEGLLLSLGFLEKA